MLSQDTQRRCGNPVCGRVFEARPTGRPPKYCSDNCRQAVHRATARAAEAAREHAARLADARAVARITFPQIEEYARTVSDRAGEVFRSAADDETSRAELDEALALLTRDVGRLDRLARDYKDAVNLAATLASTTPPSTN